MKRLVFPLLFILLIAACKKADKETQPNLIPFGTPALKNVEIYLKDSLPFASFASLDFSKARITDPDSTKPHFILIGPRDLDISTTFYVVKTDSLYRPLEGAFIQITRDSIVYTNHIPVFGFYGRIRKSYLSGQLDYESPVNGGYINALHPKRAVTVLDLSSEDNPIELPEIVIYGDDEAYYSFESLAGDGSGGFAGYSSASGVSVPSYGLSVVDELQAAKPAANLPAYFNCFNNVPNNLLTTYSASLLVKVPDPEDPDLMWAPGQADGVGHTFIQLTKSCPGYAPVTQYIGFYGQGGVFYTAATVLGFSVPSKIVDNSGHPYNASLTINLSDEDFYDLLSDLQNYSGMSYNISSSNCTTYALDAFNAVLPTPLSAGGLNIPGEVAGDTPNALFKVLQAMPADGPDGKVSISDANQTAGTGHGPCN